MSDNTTIQRIELEDIFDDDGELTPMGTTTPPKSTYKPKLPSEQPPPRPKRSSPPPRNLKEITDDIQVDTTTYNKTQLGRLTVQIFKPGDDEYESALEEYMNKNNL